MQPCLLDLSPVLTQCLPPCSREVRILGKDVFNSEFVNGHSLLPIIVLQPSQPVAPTGEVVEVVGLKVAVELLIRWHSAIGREQEKVCLDALQVPVLLK